MAVVFQRKAGSINLMERAEQQHESRQTGTVQSWECALTFCIALPLAISVRHSACKPKLTSYQLILRRCCYLSLENMEHCYSSLSLAGPMLCLQA